MNIPTPIILAVATVLMSISVAAKELVSDQKEIIPVYEQAPKSGAITHKPVKSPKASMEKSDSIDAMQTGEKKEKPRLIVNPCNGNTPPSWCY